MGWPSASNSTFPASATWHGQPLRTYSPTSRRPPPRARARSCQRHHGEQNPAASGREMRTWTSTDLLRCPHPLTGTITDGFEDASKDAPAAALIAHPRKGGRRAVRRSPATTARCGARLRPQARGSSAASAARSAARTGAATNSEVRPLRQYRLSLPSRADHAIPLPATPWAWGGLGNGLPDTATTASVPPTRHVRSTIVCPPAVTVTGDQHPVSGGRAAPVEVGHPVTVTACA